MAADSVPTFLPSERLECICKLAEEKFFGIRPWPIQEYLYQLALSQTAERVFWLHWDRAYLAKSIETQIPIEEVARFVNASKAAVFRAYAQLEAVKLLHRHATRHPHHPFLPGVPRVEISLSAELLQQMRQQAPDRPKKPQPKPVESAEAPVQVTPEPLPRLATAASVEGEPSAATESTAPPAATTAAAPTLRQESNPLPVDGAVSLPPCPPDSRALHERLRTLYADIQGLKELLAWHQPRASEAAGVTCPEREALAQQLRRLEAEKVALLAALQSPSAPSCDPSEVAPPRASSLGSQGHGSLVAQPRPKPARLLPESEKRYLHQRVAQLGTHISQPNRLIEEITYSVECGVQAHLPPRFALNAALKMVRQNTWRTPWGFPCVAATHESRGKATHESRGNATQTTRI